MIDFRTIFLVFGLISVAGAIIMYLLWSSESKSYKGLFWFFISFLGQSISLLLVFLRGSLPDVLTIVGMNFVTVFAVIAIFIGLKRFYHKSMHYWPWAVLLFLHVLLQAWFTIGEQNLHHRNVIISVSYLIVSIRILWFLRVELNQGQKHQTTALSFAFTLYCIIDVLRIINYINTPAISENYLHSNSFEVAVMLAYFFVYLLQLFGIVIMVNRALQSDMKLVSEKFMKLFNHSPNAIILTREADGYIAEVNRGLEELTGIQAIDCVGKTTIETGFWFDPNIRAKVVALLTRDGRVRNFETLFRKSNGDTFFGLLSCDPVIFNDDKYILSTIQDISEQRQLLDQLNQKTIELTKLNASKDKFFSIIAHDLKGPFNNVIALTSLLESHLKEQDFNDLEAYVQMIHKSADKALSLLLNLLDWSRLHTGRMEYTAEIVDVCKLISNELEIAELTAANKSISLNCKNCKDCLVIGDPNMLSGVFRNLISNALKFTQNGGEVKLDVNVSIEAGKAFFTVSDTGVGMDKAKLEKLFNLESNVTTYGTNHESGTGLGLLLCKEYLEKHGAQIQIESEVGKGTQISFALTLAS
jgi:PAS domain S-box-containing protein